MKYCLRKKQNKKYFLLISSSKILTYPFFHLLLKKVNLCNTIELNYLNYQAIIVSTDQFPVCPFRLSQLITSTCMSWRQWQTAVKLASALIVSGLSLSISSEKRDNGTVHWFLHWTMALCWKLKRIALIDRMGWVVKIMITICYRMIIFSVIGRCHLDPLPPEFFFSSLFGT